MLALLNRFSREDEGATMVEYALMVSLIAAFCIVVVTFVGRAVFHKFWQVGDAVANGPANYATPADIPNP